MSAPWRIIIFLALFGILGAWIVGGARSVPELSQPLVDSAVYHRQASEWAQGKNAWTGPFWQPPLYPAFLSVVYRIAGPRPAVARGVQVLLLGLGVILTFFLARHWLSARASTLAAGVTAVCGPLWFYTLQLMPVLLFLVLSLAALLLTLRLRADSRPGMYLAAGLLWGLAAVTIPTVLPAVAAGLLVRWAEGQKTKAPPVGWRGAGLFVGILLVIAPVTLRNRWVGGGWTLISANGGINFYIGNNARTDVTLAIRPGLDWERLERLPYLAGARSAVEADTYFRREAWAWARTHPGDFGLNLIRKTRDFFAAREIPRNLDLSTLCAYSPGLRILCGSVLGVRWPGGVLIPLALIGWIGLARRTAKGRWVAVYGLAFAASVILFFPASRYRAPLWPWMAIGAVAAAVGAVEAVRTARWKPLLAGILGVIGLAVAIHWPAAHPTDKVCFSAELERSVGAALEIRGDAKQAEARYRRAIELDPDNADAHYLLGNLCRTQNRADEALAHFRDALRLRPDHDSARGNLGFLLYERGERGAALAELEWAARLNPLNAAVHHNLGVVLRSVGRVAEAEVHFRKARAIRDLFAGY